jgi:hypothetical protein
MFISVPTIAWTLSYHVKFVRPSLSWTDMHYNFGLVFQLDEAQVQSVRDAYYAAMISYWLPILASFVYFLCFGMHDGVLSRLLSAYRGTVSLVSRLSGFVASPSLRDLFRWLTRPCASAPPPFFLLSRRPRSGIPRTLPTLGTTITSPSEQHWTSRRDPKVAVEDDLPYAFEAGADLDFAGRPRGHGVLVKVERDVA